MSDFPTPGYLVIKGKGDVRDVYHPDGKTKVGHVKNVNGWWCGFHAEDDKPVMTKDGKWSVTDKTLKNWKNSLRWGLSEDDLIKKA